MSPAIGEAGGGRAPRRHGHPATTSSVGRHSTRCHSFARCLLGMGGKGERRGRHGGSAVGVGCLSFLPSAFGAPTHSKDNRSVRRPFRPMRAPKEEGSRFRLCSWREAPGTDMLRSVHISGDGSGVREGGKKRFKTYTKYGDAASFRRGKENNSTGLCPTQTCPLPATTAHIIPLASLLAGDPTPFPRRPNRQWTNWIMLDENTWPLLLVSDTNIAIVSASRGIPTTASRLLLASCRGCVMATNGGWHLRVA